MLSKKTKLNISQDLHRIIQWEAKKAGLTIIQYAIEILSGSLSVTGEQMQLEDLVIDSDKVIKRLIDARLTKIKKTITDKDAEIYSIELAKAFQQIILDRNISPERAWNEFKKFDFIATKPPEWLKIAEDIFRGKRALTGEEVAGCINTFGDLDCFAAVCSMSAVKLPSLERAYAAIRN